MDVADAPPIWRALYLKMNESKCPNCKSKISLIQHAKHTWWTPITCEQCGKKWHYSKPELQKACYPIYIFLVIQLMAAFGSDYISSPILRLLIGLALVVVFLLTVFSSYKLFKQVHFVEKV